MDGILSFNQFVEALGGGNGLSVNSLRTHNTLRKDEWKELDASVVRVVQERLTGIADLRAAGLTRNLGGLGVMIDDYEKLSDTTEASMSMGVEVDENEGDHDYDIAGVPIPIISSPFRVNARRLAASRTMGRPFDTTQSEMATRKVSKMAERLLYQGSTMTVDGKQIYGYTTHPDRITGSLTAAWTASSGTDILGDVNSMLTDAYNAGYEGPFNIYVPDDFFPPLWSDYKTESERTFLDRILDYPGINAVKPSSQMPAGEVVLVQMTSDVVDLSVGQDIMPIEWASKGGLVQHFLVMGAMAPRVKSDYEGNTGIVHYS